MDELERTTAVLAARDRGQYGDAEPPPTAIRYDERAEIERLTVEYLEGGGVIELIPFGVGRAQLFTMRDGNAYYYRKSGREPGRRRRAQA